MMLEMLDPEPLEPRTDGTSTLHTLPSLDIVNKPIRVELLKGDPAVQDSIAHVEAAAPKDHKVQSIDEMLKLFNNHVPVVFVGGQMATYDEMGHKSIATDREKLKIFCEKNNIYYYDPIHGEPENPTFAIARFTDKTALLLSPFDILSFGKETLGGVSVMEALFDKYLDDNPNLIGKRLLYLPDAVNKYGFDFSPPGIVLTENGQIDLEKSAHKTLITYFEEAHRVGNLLRCELLNFCKEARKLRRSDENLPGLVRIQSLLEFQTLQQNPEYSCYEISNTDLHIHDIIKCFSDVFENKKVAIYFHPPVDKDNNPIMEKPLRDEKNLKRILSDYAREGRAIRAHLIDKLAHDPNTIITHSAEELEQQTLKNYREIGDFLLTEKLAIQQDLNLPPQ